MKYLKKRPVALILCLLIVCASTLLNTRVKLGRQSEELREQFYSTDGVAPWLETLHTEAGVLEAVAEKNEIDASALHSASEMLQRALSQRELGVASLYPYYDKLRTELRSLGLELQSTKLTAQQSSTLEDCLRKIDSAENAISTSEYNTRVRAFLSRNGSGFTRALAGLTGVVLPEEFA